MLQDLSLNMRAIVSQRLIQPWTGRAAAIEILVGTPRAADLIAKGAVSGQRAHGEIHRTGMQTFDQSFIGSTRRVGSVLTSTEEC